MSQPHNYVNCSISCCHILCFNFENNLYGVGFSEILKTIQEIEYETMRNEFAMNGRDTEYSPDNKMSILRELERKKRMISAASAPGKCRYLCKFCKKNGESERVYISHNLKDDNGLILCPILRNYTCPHCHASGDRAHTVKYCSLPRYYY